MPIDKAHIETTLYQALPTVYAALVPRQAAIVADTANNAITEEPARAQVTALPGVAGLAEELREPASGALASFVGSQIGEVKIGAVAGHDIVTLLQAIVLPPERPCPQFFGDYTLPALYIERRAPLDRLRDQLLATSEPTPTLHRPIALHGMGGCSTGRGCCASSSRASACWY